MANVTKNTIPVPPVPDHNGEPLDERVELFVSPPAEIGTVLSAGSTLRKTDRTMSPTARKLLGGGLGGILAVGLLALALTGDEDRRTPAGVIMGAGVLAGLGLYGIVMYLTRFKRNCSFVGTHGLARYRLVNSREATPVAEVFRFDTATALRVFAIARYHNGVYTGTEFVYGWQDDAEKAMFVIDGQHYKEKPARDNKLWFAKAAEAAWNRYLFPKMLASVAQNGYASFALDGKDWVRVGQGWFEFFIGGQLARITSEEIKSISLDDGQFSIVHKDAGWFSSKGKYHFSYGSMANAQMFVMVCDRLIGIRHEAGIVAV